MELKDGIDPGIILINIGNGDRAYLANLIERVNACSPKVIGFEAFFFKLEKLSSDSLLANAIANAPVILAISHHYKKKPRMSHRFFSSQALANGTVGAITQMKLANKFIPISEYKFKSFRHFGIEIAQIYDSLATAHFLKSVKPNEECIIEYTKLESNFVQYDFNQLDFDCEELADKIVLLGYLGPTGEDKFHTPMKLVSLEAYSEEKDTYGVTILANIIRMILDFKTID